MRLGPGEHILFGSAVVCVDAGDAFGFALLDRGDVESCIVADDRFARFKVCL